MEVFQQLGREVENLWREKNYAEEMFPVIAAHALRDFNLPEKVSAWDTIKWTLGETTLPEQRDLPGRFGDPPITLYNSPRFHIDIYFWLDGTTSIHQHGFCGAFQVILGSSIHSSYEFETTEVINTFTEMGDINLDDCELLEVGDVRKILAGKQFIHSLFHLDQPSATIVVRTHSSPLHLPQFDYKKPFLALDPFFSDPHLTKKLQSVTMILRVRHEDADRLLGEMLETADFQTSFSILSNTRHLLQHGRIEQFFQVGAEENRFTKMFEIVKKRHGSLAESLIPVFAHQDKISEIINRRSFITNPEHRFFLALLLNVEGREQITTLIKKRYPESEPLDKILDWTTELAQTKIFGSNLPNALGIADFNDFDSFVLEDLLKDVSLSEMRENFLKDSPHEDAESVEKNLAERIKKLQDSVILQPVLAK